MKSDPRAVLRRLKAHQFDADSVAAQEMIEEVAERVLRNLTPHEKSLYFPDLNITKTEPSEA